MRAWPLLLALLAGGSAVAQVPGGAREAQLVRMVRQDCGSCHGMTLKGGLGPDLRATRLSGVPSKALAAIILDGIPGTPMPPWRGLLSEQDAIWIAEYLKAETNR